MHDPLASFKQSNRHPVDRLGELRELIKAAKDAEKELIDQVGDEMGDGDSAAGVEFIAEQFVSERRGSYDDKKVIAGLGEAAANACRKKSTTVFSIRTRRRADACEA